jgi:chemotaxis protein methyltransferase CheR
MNGLLTEAMLQKISARIAEWMGLDFPPSKWMEIERAFSNAAKDYGFQGAVEYANWFLSAPLSREIIKSMAGRLTIGETYFLREPQCFKAFEQKLIPEIVRSRQASDRRIRIWSAACATGEESYTIAILLHRMRNLLCDWDVSILASDIDTHSLDKAKEGEYGAWSFRNAPQWFRDNYFTKKDRGRYQIIDSIKRMVNFAYINLAEDCYPSFLNDTNAVDLIFCRNLLMYFTPGRAKLALEHFHRCLVEGGWLMVGPCEFFNPGSLGFTPLNYPDAVVFCKNRPAVLKKETRKWETPIAGINNIEPQLLYPQNKVAEKSMDSAPLPIHPMPAISDQPDLYEKSQDLYRQGLYAEAGNTLADLTFQDSNHTLATVLMCRSYANEGKLFDALHLSDQAIAADKLNAELHYLRAIILQEQGMVSEAIESLKRTLYLDPNMVLAHFRLGNLNLKQGKSKESRKYFNNALELLSQYNPDDIVPESDGFLAGRLMEIIRSTGATA